jgi:hypothetical protein
MSQNSIKNRKEVKRQKFASVEIRKTYGRYAWFSEKTGEFMLVCKEKDVIDLDNCR